MNCESKSFKALDILLLVLCALPIAFMIVLKVLFTPAGGGIDIHGALIYAQIDMPLQPLCITESLVNSWCVIVSVLFLCLYLTHGTSERPETRRQLVAEWIVEKTQSLVNSNMQPYFKNYAPFIGGIMVLSAFSSLLTLFGLYPPTSDISIVGGWALLVACMITHFKMKCGPLHYLKDLATPAVMTPMNIIGEFSTPISMAFRHYGNVLSGSVISVLIAAALGGLSDLMFSWAPEWLSGFQILRVGLPAVLSLYFDIFSGCLQAFIFAMLTMLYVSGGFASDDYFARKAKRAAKKSNKANI